MWLLRKITAVFFLLSLLLWTLVTLLLMCEPMANEYPQVSLRDYKVMKRVAPSGNKSVEGEFFFFFDEGFLQRGLQSYPMISTCRCCRVVYKKVTITF